MERSWLTNIEEESLKIAIHPTRALFSALFFLTFLCSLAYAENEKKSHIYASLLGGFISKVEFVSSFANVDRQIYEASSELHPMITTASGTGMGFALGYSYDMPDVDGIRISLYGELNYHPKTVFPDGDEWEYGAATYDWTSYRYIYDITPRKRTSSSASMYGLTLGGVIKFFPSIPVGLDFGLGYMRFNLKYLSETCSEYSSGGDFGILGYTEKVRYAGHGWLENSCDTFSIKLGLQIRLMRNLSLCASWTDLIYTKQYVSSSWVYVDGSPVIEDAVFGAGNIIQIGLIFAY